MNIELTTRGVLSAFFRQRQRFMAVFLTVLACGVLYLALAKPEYEAAGSLLVRFGHDTASEVTRSEGSPQVISQNDRRELMQSNMDILESHNLLRTVINELGAEALYPGITARVAGSDTPEEAAIRRLHNDLTVKSSQQSNVIDVSLFNGDPKLAAAFIHRLFELFITRQSEVFNKPQTDFIQEQVAQAQAKLEHSQKELENFKARSGISSLDTELAELLRQKADTGTVSLGTMDDAWAKLADLQSKERQMLATYQPDSPQVKRMRENVRLARRQLEERQDDLSSRTGKATAKIDQRITVLEAKRKRYNDLLRQVEIDEENYKNYQFRAEDARIGDRMNQRNISSIAVVDEPVVPTRQARPRRTLVAAMTLLSALVLAGGIAFLFETFDQRFTAPEQLARVLGVPVMASFAPPGDGYPRAEHV